LEKKGNDEKNEGKKLKKSRIKEFGIVGLYTLTFEIQHLFYKGLV